MKSVVDWAFVSDKQLAEGDAGLGDRIKIWVDAHLVQGHKVVSQRIEPDIIDVTNQNTPNTFRELIPINAGVQYIAYIPDPPANWRALEDGTVVPG